MAGPRQEQLQAWATGGSRVPQAAAQHRGQPSFTLSTVDLLSDIPVPLALAKCKMHPPPRTAEQAPPGRR